MNAENYIKMPIEKKRKIFKAAAKGANKDQRAVIEKAKKMSK
jgi:hypothetical protein